MKNAEKIQSYLRLAMARRGPENPYGIPEEVKISISEALSIIGSKDANYRKSSLYRQRDRIVDNDLCELLRLCVRFEGLLSPVEEFVMATSGFPLQERLVPIHSRLKVDRRKSMLGTLLWTCENFGWPMSELNGKPMSPLLQINLRELRPYLLEFAQFPDLIVQVWGDDIWPHVRTIPLSVIEKSNPNVGTQNWNNEHIYYGVTENSSGSFMDLETVGERIIYGEYLGIGERLPFAYCRDTFRPWRVRSEIESFIGSLDICEPEYSPILFAALFELEEIFYHLMDQFEETTERFRSPDGHFFGDVALRQSSYSEYFGLSLDDPEGGWRLLYQPSNRCISLPGLTILFDGNMALFWRVKDGRFDFQAVADR